MSPHFLAPNAFDFRRHSWREKGAKFVFEFIERGFGKHRLLEIDAATRKQRIVVAEDSERWPAEVKALFKAAIPEQVMPTPRSPWKNTGGIPNLHRSPSGRAACRFCQQKLGKGELRIGREQVFGMRRSGEQQGHCQSPDPRFRNHAASILRRGRRVKRRRFQQLHVLLCPVSIDASLVL